MITADTSTWVAFLDGALGDDVLLLKKALQGRQLSMLPVVLTELLSDPRLPPAVAPPALPLTRPFPMLRDAPNLPREIACFGA